MGKILTRQELQDAAKCKGKCFQCHKKYCQEQIARTALSLADMLKRLEWSGRDEDHGHYPADEVCPICENTKAFGHKPDCELVALLKGLEG